jgi:hypothetical protein
MEGFLLLLAFPLIWPVIAKKIFGSEISWIEVLINIVSVVLIVSLVWTLGTLGQTWDTEIWNGKIVNKKRVHDTYEESYDCFCTSVCTGSGSNQSCSEVCQTCYRTHYTVKWNAYANFGLSNETIVLKYLDETHRSVYNSPDPKSFIDCKIGEPASKTSSYTNYVQAVPDSLFNMATISGSYLDQVPPYPSVVGHYKYNRVIDVNSGVHSLLREDLNTRLNEALITLGSKKQVNIIVIVTGNTDPSYRYAVENVWVGGKKNDAVVFIGMSNEEIVWADVMTFALNKGNELYNVTLRDSIVSIETFDPEQIANTITEITNDKFDRISMKEFEYLKDQIKPSSWVIGFAVFIAIFGSIGLSFLFQRVDIANNSRYN